jgi:hypothetical protein
VVKKFNQEYRKWIEDKDLVMRAFALQTKATYPLDAQLTNEYEWLDQQKIEGIIRADRKCRKLKMGEVPWSPRLQILCNQLGYWQLVTKKIQGQRVSTRLIERIRQKGQVERRLLREIKYEEVEEAERLAYKKYMTFKCTHSKEARDTFLDELADAIAKDGNIRHESVLKTLKTREYTRRTN